MADMTTVLVAITGADAAQRRADALTPDLVRIQGSIFGDMPGEDDVRSLADHQSVDDRNSPRREPINFLEDDRRVEHHAGSNQVHDAVGQDAAGNLMQLVGLVPDDDRVTGIGTPLIPHHDVDMEVLGEQVDEFPLRLITPLQPNHTRSWHGNRLRMNPTRPRHPPGGRAQAGQSIRADWDRSTTLRAAAPQGTAVSRLGVGVDIIKPSHWRLPTDFRAVIVDPFRWPHRYPHSPTVGLVPTEV